ncbi:hypothetical protein M404DRAFT_34504 [Pisolithus tinctorius Marx 270]|uniref:Cyclic nucleotide-binding domain-containing protein n=1 Tax=Pisolithus tinctorius Marx 270 TaxID=870435 RepID=A0A0C3NHY1_PISTI|nr:hypothetical protein M404DRAFT_34504 [Pisolithus tinctorius Marx 270]
MLSPSLFSLPLDEGYLHRAGLLQRRNYSTPLRILTHPRVSGDIRENTVQLSNFPFPSPGRSFVLQEPPFTSDHGPQGQRAPVRDFDSDHAHPVPRSSPVESVAFLPYDGQDGDGPAGDLDFISHPQIASLDIASASASDFSALSPAVESSQETGTSQKMLSTTSHDDTSFGSPLFTPSGLSFLLTRKLTTPNDGSMPSIVEHSRSSSFITGGSLPDKPRCRERDEIAARESGIFPIQEQDGALPRTLSETAPLLPRHTVIAHRDPPFSLGPPKKTILTGLGSRLRRAFDIDVDICDVAKIAISSVPAVIFGALLNILDGLSYGMIMFPASGVFTNLGGMGVSLFFVSTVISQFIFSFGGSQFAGANGSMMIETVPFFHIIASAIEREIGKEHVREVIATTLVAYALSSVLTGLTFLLLGYLRLGVVIGFFPRHILVGCIGGVGVFLILTGLTVSTRLPSDALDPPTWDTLRYLTTNAHALGQWMPPLALAILMRVITSRWKHQLVFPIYFLVIPVAFYVIVIAAGLDLDRLRRDGWLFDSAGTTGSEGWYEFYTYFGESVSRHNDWMPMWNTLPTQFALFYRVGGGNRIAGLMLALVTLLILMVGTAPVAYIPVVVVGALIFALGIDLVKEALWDTRYRVSWTEYVTIVSIMVTMTVWDFVIGVLFGIINSRRRSIRACYPGNAAMSTVRRPAAHRAYIHDVSKQTRIIQLQGFLFFGTIMRVEEKLRSIVEDPDWRTNPVRFIIVDLTLVPGVDMSAGEAFVRVQRLLAAKGVVLVFCGVESESGVGKALANSGILEEKGVEVFESLNDALECEWSRCAVLVLPLTEAGPIRLQRIGTENEYLGAWFRLQRAGSTPIALAERQGEGVGFHEAPVGSPRERYLRDAGNRTIVGEPFSSGIAPEPLNTLLKAFQSYEEIDRDVLVRLSTYFTRLSLPSGHVLWDVGDTPDGLYIIQSGVLRASYRFGSHTRIIGESMVSGALAGELSGLSGLPRNARVAVEREAVVWWLGREALRRLEREDAALAWTFVRMVLKGE